MATMDDPAQQNLAAPAAVAGQAQPGAAWDDRARAPVRPRRRLRVYVPGTREFMRRVEREIGRRAVWQARRFASLNSLDTDTKKALRRAVRSLAALSGGVEVRKNRFTFAALVLASLLYIGGFIFAGFAAFGNTLDRMPARSVNILYFFVVIVSMAGWFYAFVGPGMLATRFHLISRAINLGWPVLLVFAYAAGYYYLATRYRQAPLGLAIFLLLAVMRGAYLVLSFLIVTLVVVLPLFAIIEYVFKWQARMQYPQAVMVERLLSVLDQLELRGETWLDSFSKVLIVPSLEEVAVCLERGLFQQLRAGDTGTDIQVRNTLAARAAAMRELKQWILTPKPDTYDHLRQRVAQNLLHAINGHWDSLTATEPQKVSLAEGVSSRAGRALRTLTAGALPVLALLVVRKLGLPLDSALAQYLTLGVVLWSALTLLRLIDPDVGSTLDSLDKVRSIFGLGGGK